jgi:hypothetical protein
MLENISEKVQSNNCKDSILFGLQSLFIIHLIKKSITEFMFSSFYIIEYNNISISLFLPKYFESVFTSEYRSF